MPKSAYRPEAAPLSRNTRKAIAGLQEFYSIGQDALRKSKLVDGRSPYGNRVVQTFADHEGICGSLIYEARNFAVLYSQAEFDELIDLCTTFNVPFGSSHIIELLRIKEPHLRKELQQAAAENRMSVRDLHVEVKKILGKA